MVIILINLVKKFDSIPPEHIKDYMSKFRI